LAARAALKTSARAVNDVDVSKRALGNLFDSDQAPSGC